MSRIDTMICNKPVTSWRSGKKKAVKACVDNTEKIIHFGAVGYGHNYSAVARDNFRSRQKCDTATDKLTARYWACEYLWSKGGESEPCPSDKKCKYKVKSVKKSRRKKSKCTFTHLPTAIY